MDGDKLGNGARAFVARFLPAGMDSGHSLLYGARGEDAAPGFVPSPEILALCLRDYEVLVEAAAAEQTYLLAEFDLMDASEMVIAFLSRAMDAGLAAPRCEGLIGLIRKHGPELRALVDRLGGAGQDACKRFVKVGELLESTNRR